MNPGEKGTWHEVEFYKAVSLGSFAVASFAPEREVGGRLEASSLTFKDFLQYLCCALHIFQTCWKLDLELELDFACSIAGRRQPTGLFNVEIQHVLLFTIHLFKKMLGGDAMGYLSISDSLVLPIFICCPF